MEQLLFIINIKCSSLLLNQSSLDLLTLVRHNNHLMFCLILLYNNTSELKKTAELSDKDAHDTDQPQICPATRLFLLNFHHTEKRISVAEKLRPETYTHEEKILFISQISHK